MRAYSKLKIERIKELLKEGYSHEGIAHILAIRSGTPFMRGLKQIAESEG